MQVGDIVHYVSHGTPLREDGTQAYQSTCRAAIITSGNEPHPDRYDDKPGPVALVVLNPTGMFFNENVEYDPTRITHGTWHYCIPPLDEIMPEPTD